MASLPHHSSPAKHKEEEEKEAVMSSKLSKYSDIIAELPTKKGWQLKPIYKYGDFWYDPLSLAATMAFQEEFKPLSSDIFLATNPKSGTTWIKALAFAIVHRATFASDNTHPLLTSSPHACVPFLEDYYKQLNGAHNAIDSLSSPRLLAMHFPYSALPLSVTSAECRLVYLCRDAKDTFISLWHFLKKHVAVTFDEAFEMFCEGLSPRGPAWEHMLEYWMASLQHPGKVLFLIYEELRAEPVKNVIRLAEFIGYPFSEEEMKGGVVEDIVKLCSFETLSKVEANINGEYNARLATFKNSDFFRKGKIGDWKEHLSPEMAQKLDDIVEEKLKGSGLTFRR